MINHFSHNTRRITTLIYPGANSVDVSGPLQVFSTASRLLQEQDPERSVAYLTEVIGQTAEPLRISAGLTLIPEYHLTNAPKDIDTLFIAGGLGAQKASKEPAIQTWLNKAAPDIRRLASVCTGAFILAEAGLLDNHRATTHWQYADMLAADYPNIMVDQDAIFTYDGSIYCSAGVTAGIDLALALVEDDYGHELALAVARQMVVFLKRPGGQSQFSELLENQFKVQSPVYKIQQWIFQNLSQPLSIDTLADKAAMSPRHFSRVFIKATGLSPGKFIIKARVDKARNLLESTALSLDAITEKCGIGNTETLRRLFWQHFHTSPRSYRERFRSHQPAISSEIHLNGEY